MDKRKVFVIRGGGVPSLSEIGEQVATLGEVRNGDLFRMEPVDAADAVHCPDGWWAAVSDAYKSEGDARWVVNANQA